MNRTTGGDEDGWDSVDHAIAEYDFRPSAVPVFVLVQNQEGRIAGSSLNSVNNTLTRDGILAALKSKNVILDTLTVGQYGGNGRLFDLEPYGLNSEVRVLGVDADGADGMADGQHNYHGFNTVTNQTFAPQPTDTTIADTLQISYNGSNTGATGMVGTGKSILISKTITDGIGPSAEGYRAKSVPFAPVTTTGTVLLPGPDGSYAYSFNFFGTTYPRLWVNPDGTITFPATPTGTTNTDPGGNNVDLSHLVAGQDRPTVPTIAAMWDDLFGSAIQASLQEVDADGVLDLVVKWSNFRYPGDNALYDFGSFQAVLFANGDIRFNYQDIDSYPGFTSGDTPTPDGDTTVYKTGGINATVGIWKGVADPITIPAGKFVPGPHSINGDSEGAGSGESNDSYVRMAWDTGGSAWDIGVVATYGITSAPANELRDQFVGGLASQINAAASVGNVARDDTVIYAYNLGDGAIAAEGFAADPFTSGGTRSTTSAIDTKSNSIPRVGGVPMQNVFKTARQGAIVPNPSDLVLSTPALNNLPDGFYIVELFFAPFGSGSTFDVLIEGKTLLNNYTIGLDFGRITQFVVGGNPSPDELDVARLDTSGGTLPAGVVKRFLVDVGGADGQAGLQIRLNVGVGAPFLNGLRILRPVPGDYNRNGRVESADYTVWRDTLGSTSDLRADGDANGVIDANDYIVWKSGYGSMTGLVMADFSGNGAVDIADYALWTSTEGSTTDLRADCNEDGIVNDEDYEIWFDTFGSTLEIGQFGLLSSFFAPDAPPAVVGFALSLPGDATVDFAGRVGSGEQIRSVPLTAANTLSVTFSQDVNVMQSALQVINLDGSSPSVVNFAYDVASQTATWTFAGALADGRYLVRLSDAVENLDGDALDGEFVNPWSLTDVGSSVFPSGDGEEGGEFRFRFTVLLADSNHDNVSGSTNYVNWKSTEPGMILVSTTADDYDADLSFGDVSLREAVNYANGASEATTIVLPAGRYTLSRIGTETTANVALNDLDVTGNVRIEGYGPGVSIIDNSGLASQGSGQGHTFDVYGALARLRLSRLTIANGSSMSMGQVACVVGGATLEIFESAIDNHTVYAGASAIQISDSHLVVSRSVFTNNDDTSIYGGTAINVTGSASAPASITVGESIFALNRQPAYGGGSTYFAIKIAGTVTKVNNGKNLYDYAGGGFFDTTPGAGDYVGTPTYVVTSVADTFEHSDDLEALSVREAVDLANQASGQQEIWIPAWDFVLTRDRGSHASDTDVSYGDLDVKDSLKIRGISGYTSIAWKPNVVDKVFDLVGDFNTAGESDYGTVSSADYTIWQNQNGLSGAFEQFSADADDDGDVDQDDYDLAFANYGHTLELFDVGV